MDKALTDESVVELDPRRPGIADHARVLLVSHLSLVHRSTHH